MSSEKRREKGAHPQKFEAASLARIDRAQILLHARPRPAPPAVRNVRQSKAVPWRNAPLLGGPPSRAPSPRVRRAGAAGRGGRSAAGGGLAPTRGGVASSVWRTGTRAVVGSELNELTRRTARMAAPEKSEGVYDEVPSGGARSLSWHAPLISGILSRVVLNYPCSAPLCAARESRRGFSILFPRYMRADSSTD